METFENWYTSILEEVATAPTKSLSRDVDTIIDSLGSLVKELTEELDSPEFNEVNEADAEGPSKVWQWIWWMPKARKAQQKVNKIKLNVTDMEAASSDAPDKDQRDKISAKASIARDQAGELQKMIDDKYGAKGELVKKALSSEKIAGQIASIKRATGLEDTPEKIASYKEKMAELQVKYKEDQAAITELEPSEEDKKAEIAKKKAEQKKIDDAKAAKAPKKDDTTATDDTSSPTKDDTATPATDDTEAPAKDDTTPKNDAPEATTDPKVKALEDEITKLEQEIETSEKSPNKDKAGIETLKGIIADKKKKLETLKASESLVTRANAVGLNELAVEIASKFDWQVSEGTVLHQKYDAIIKKAEYSNSLNESRYQNLSVKDRFSRLL
jgi:hypothetical protein